MNKYRSESQITINDKQYTLRPTFEALSEIEEATGTSVFGVIKKMSDPLTCRAKDLAIIIRAGIVGSGEKKAPSVSEIGAYLQSVGFTSVLPTLFKFLTTAITPDADLKGPEAATEGQPGN